MSLGSKARLGLGGAALALVAVAGIGFNQAPPELPTVTVYRSPT